jgi:hypothetical protein
MKKAILTLALFAAFAACNNNSDTGSTTAAPAGTGSGSDTSAAPDSGYTGSGINTGSGALTSTDTGNQRRNQ